MYDPNENTNLTDKQEAPRQPQQPVAPSYGYTASRPTEPGVTYHTGPVQSGSAYFPRQSMPYPQQGQQPPAAAYSWGPSQQPPQNHYYAPIQPPKQKKQRHPGRFLLKLLAVVLACAVVSMGSVGVFVMMIQNGTVNIQSQGEENTTAAFTIYKRAESDQKATPTVSVGPLTAQEVARKVVPSIVCIQNYRITQQGGFFWGYGYSGYGDSELSPAGEGSGIILSKDGYIVTNQHVIDGATSLKVVTSEGLTYEAELVGEDTQTDLAVIKITTEDELTPAEFGSSQDLAVADEVMAVGNPGGMQFNFSVTFGHISALDRPVVSSDSGYTISCIQTDAAINPGNSGGALVDMDGHVVGINSSKIVATGYEGLGFAIPSDTVQPIVSDLIEFGYVKDRPALGFDGQYVDRLTASFFGMSSGYYVTQITSSEARDAGLERGDMIVAIDEAQVVSEGTMAAYIAEKKPGDTVSLTVERSGQRGQITLALSENTGKSDDVSYAYTW